MMTMSRWRSPSRGAPRAGDDHARLPIRLPPEANQPRSNRHSHCLLRGACYKAARRNRPRNLAFEPLQRLRTSAPVCAANKLHGPAKEALHSKPKINVFVDCNDAHAFLGRDVRLRLRRRPNRCDLSTYPSTIQFPLRPSTRDLRAKSHRAATGPVALQRARARSTQSPRRTARHRECSRHPYPDCAAHVQPLSERAL